jgi:hypothetical protein
MKSQLPYFLDTKNNPFVPPPKVYQDFGNPSWIVLYPEVNDVASSIEIYVPLGACVQHPEQLPSGTYLASVQS